MKKKILILVFSCIWSIVIFPQSRMVINNNAYLVIDNSAYLVIDNSNANALAVAGTGGSIISEAENDRIKWNIGTATGAYSIPWSTSVATGAVKIPLSVTVTGAGVGAGNIIFSTYETTTDANTPWQSGVTNMCSAITNSDGSLLVVDRFWQINANGYGTKPSVNMTIAYNPAANELIGTNTLVEANLQAQRFNPGAVAGGPCYVGAGSWETTLFGTNNAAVDNVTNIIVPAADFFKDWILVDNANPLPVTLSNFSLECANNQIKVIWTTQTEINNDYFVLEKSYDGFVFFDVVTINGNGNSNVSNSYEASLELENKIVYLRLKQVDFDGTINYSNVIASNCISNSFEVTQLQLTEDQLDFTINSIQDDQVQVYLYDYRGRLIVDQNKTISKGLNEIGIDHFDLSSGIYLLTVIGQQNIYSTKLLRR